MDTPLNEEENQQKEFITNNTSTKQFKPKIILQYNLINYDVYSEQQYIENNKKW